MGTCSKKRLEDQNLTCSKSVGDVWKIIWYHPWCLARGKKSTKIIANPNCSTIQLAVALNEIHQKFGLKRIVISTYQSVTGTGTAAVTQMNNERKGLKSKKIYPHPIDQNCFPHGGDFLENGYTSEEMKLVDETQKIFNDNNIKITATVVRIPVIGGHRLHR